MKTRSKKKLDNIYEYSRLVPEGNNVKHDQFFKRSLEKITNLRKQPVMVPILHKQASFIWADGLYHVNLKLLSLCSVTFLSLCLRRDEHLP